MPTFRYKAVTPPGEVLEGLMEAASQAAVIDHLRGQGLLPIRAEERGAGSLGDWLNRELGGRKGLSRADMVLTIRELGMLLRSGLPLDQALQVLATYTEKEGTRLLINGILEKVRGGASLADAFAADAGSFDRFTIGMVRAGEAGGSLDVVLGKTAEFLERVQQSKQNLRSALVYPIILLVTACASIAVIVTVVIPSFEEIFTDAGFKLPVATRIVMGVGSIAEQFWWLPPLVLLLGFLFFARERRNAASRKRWDLRLLKVPLIGDLVTKAEVARVTYTLGMLLTNGVPMLAALSVARETLGNEALADAFVDVQRAVKEGKSFAQPLEATGLFPRLATHLLRIGEESGRLEDMLFRVADTHEQEVQRGIQRALTLLVPAVTIVMALLIAGIVVSILVPMLSIHELVV